MTREEAIRALERADGYVGIHYINGVEEAYINPHLREAVKVALSALRPVSREQVERLWPGCDRCKAADTAIAWERWGHQYCSQCGRPLTPEAWEELRKRLEALNNDKK